MCESRQFNGDSEKSKKGRHKSIEPAAPHRPHACETFSAHSKPMPTSPQARGLTIQTQIHRSNTGRFI
jgi:hypothetical protein